jgi:hypothetical protein
LKTDDISESDFKSFDIRYNVSVKEKQAINVQDLMALIGVLKGVAAPSGAAAPPSPPQFIGLYGGGLVGSINNLPDDIVFEAKVTFPKLAVPEKDKHDSTSAPSPSSESTVAGARFVVVRHSANRKQSAASGSKSNSSSVASTGGKRKACRPVIAPSTQRRTNRPLALSAKLMTMRVYTTGMSASVYQ